MLVLTTNNSDPNWPDGINRETGVLTYFGDNKKPGRLLHETPRHGNEILRDIFNRDLRTKDGRLKVPPILVFSSTHVWRDVRFLGLAVPGGPGGVEQDDLVAVWRTQNGQRFQNYRARFTILDTESVRQDWIRALNASSLAEGAPRAWVDWIEKGTVRPLAAPRTIAYRTKSQQTPSSSADRATLQSIYDHFAADSVQFEHFAAAITRMHLTGVAELEVTRPSRDGGRDAIGKMLIGEEASSILIEFAIEAKRFTPGKGVGVKSVSRLISRLRHRQFGVLVTTSHLDTQAYREIVEDAHPIVVISGRDIVDILRRNHLSAPKTLAKWLSGFPPKPQ